MYEDIGQIRIPACHVKPHPYDITNPALKDAAVEYGRSWFEHVPTRDNTTHREKPGSGRGCLFLGASGTGKSFAMAGIARALSRCTQTIWLNVHEQFAWVERNRYAPKASARIDQWRRVRLLFADDVALVKPGTYGHDLLQEIVEVRYNARLPTCWTGNLTVSADLHEIEDMYGVMIARRLIETSRGFTVRLNLASEPMEAA